MGWHLMCVGGFVDNIFFQDEWWKKVDLPRWFVLEQSLMSGSLYSYALLTFVRVISFLYQMLVGPSGDYHTIVLFGVSAFVYYMEW